MFGNYGKLDPKTKEILQDSKDPWGKDLKAQEPATREAIIQYMIDQKFPGGDKVTTKTTRKEIQGPTAFQIQELNRI